MTEVAFHFNVPERFAYVCRLVRKVRRKGARVVVMANEADVLRLDQLLWSFSARDFIPHCRLPAPADVVQASPVVLGGTPELWPHHEVMINLGTQVPVGFERFDRLIEIVTGDDSDRHHARERWRHYGARGYAIVRHDVSVNS